MIEKNNLSSKLEIIHQDQDILVVNKTPGLVVNRAKTVKGATLQDWLEENVPEIGKRQFIADWQDQIPADFSDEYGSPEKIFSQRSGIAHRLDKDTSGAILVAKHPGSLLHLLKQFKERSIEKRYTCLVHGEMPMEQGEINLPLGRRSKNRKLFGVVADGRPATTFYQVKQFFPEFKIDKLMEEKGTLNKKSVLKKFDLSYGFTLLEAYPKTGRTHQIRVHLSHLQHPIVSDIFYVGKKRIKIDGLWCQRQFLHASQITISHPRSQERLSFEAELSDDLKRALTYLK